MKRVFISFRAEDRNKVNGLRLLSANPDFEIEFYDESVRTPYDSNDPVYIRRMIREKIARTSVTVCMVSALTHTSQWVTCELEERIDKGSSIICMGFKDGPGLLTLPEPARRLKLLWYSWDHDALHRMIASAPPGDEHTVQDLPDFFISRAGADALFSEAIGHILENAGHSALLQQWDFANHNFMERMDAALASGARVVGNVLLTQGSLSAALDSYETVLAMIDRLAPKPILEVPSGSTTSHSPPQERRRARCTGQLAGRARQLQDRAHRH